MRQDVLHLTNISARTENAAGDLGLMMNNAGKATSMCPCLNVNHTSYPYISKASQQRRQVDSTASTSHLRLDDFTITTIITYPHRLTGVRHITKDIEHR